MEHEEGYDETTNSNKNIVAENNEPIVEILLQEKTLTDNNIENERANLESKKEIVKDKCEVDKTCEENTHLEKESDHNSTENIASESDELNEKIPIVGDTSTDNTVESENVLFQNLRNTTTESVNGDNLYVEDPLAGDHIENLKTDDDNREETVNDTKEEGLEKDDQNEDSSVISDQSFHPEEDNIEVYD